MEVSIPFQERFRDKMLEGKKVCTSRVKQFGEAWDTFTAFNTQFEITAVEKLTLHTVATNLYKAEGFDHPTGFIDIWHKLHPIKGFVSHQIVFVHWFRKVE